MQTGLAIDPHTVDNGALKIFPGSHKLGYLGLSEEGYLMTGGPRPTPGQGRARSARSSMRRDESGDITLWHPLAVHGSGPNVSGIDRRLYINGYARPHNTDRGEWAFRNGEPCPLGRRTFAGALRTSLHQAGAALRR